MGERVPGFGRGKRGPQIPKAPRGAAIHRKGCERCDHGEDTAPCTCDIQDRCAEHHAPTGTQCILGAGHGMRHVNAAGRHWA